MPIFSNLIKKFSRPTIPKSNFWIADFIHASWSDRHYYRFAEEGFKRNVIANRCISMIAKSAASVDWLLYQDHDKSAIIRSHPLLKLLNKPNPRYGGAEFFETLYSQKIISGNAFILALKGGGGDGVQELHLLRPDRVEVKARINGMAAGYLYQAGEEKYYYPVDNITGKCDILHLRSFNPLDDWYRLSQVEAASYSIELHNQSSEWNKSLLENGAKPSGAMVVKNSDGSAAFLDDEQYDKLRLQLDKYFSGSKNAGRPFLLEGGLEWQEMSFSPKDMDFIEAKNSAARDIALAFGVPPQLLGIKGDNTYNNMQEARLAFLEETILPLVDRTLDALNNWIVGEYPGELELSYNINEISALSLKQEQLWDRVKNADFLSGDKKRAIVKVQPSTK
jgi:HK97 family phage portal protein